jgi:type IV secretion system protein TrbL
MPCSKLDVACQVGEGIQGIVTDQLENLANKIGEMAIAGLHAVSTAWVTIKAPTLATETSKNHYQPSETIAFLQKETFWIVAVIAVFSVLIAGVRTVWEMRAAPLRELAHSLVTMVLVLMMGTMTIQVLVEASDAFSLWLIDEALPENESFETRIGTMVLVGAASQTSLLPQLVVMFLGVAVFAAAVAQVLLMLVRSAMLVVLVGTFPLAAAATNTDLGRQWFKKYVAWTLAFIAYKPAAAVIYAAAMKLTKAGMLNPGDGLGNALTGLMMMLLAIFALPALLRFAVPVTAAVAGGGAGSGAGLADPGNMATGAISVGRSKLGSGMASGGGGGGGGGAAGGGAGGGASGAIGVGAAAGPAAAITATIGAAKSATQKGLGAIAGAASHSGGEAGGGGSSGASGSGGAPMGRRRKAGQSAK